MVVNTLERLRTKIESRHARICVVGLGRVGLRLAFAISEANFPTTGIDADVRIIANLKTGRLPFNEPSLRNQKPSFNVSSKLTHVAKCDIVVVCVSTSLRRRRPDIRNLESLISTAAASLRPGQCVIIQTTVPPGTTKQMAARLEALSGLKIGETLAVAYCPERLSPGSIKDEIVSMPRVVGGIDAASTALACEFWSRVFIGPIHATDSLTAEIAKLAENTYRDVNVALANEIAEVCEEYGADVMDVVSAANTHPRVNLHFPGPGVGGACLPKDPYYLGSKSGVIYQAREKNDSMPRHSIQLIWSALNASGLTPAKSEILVAGTAYKSGTDDSRNSPARTIIEKLLEAGARTLAYDRFTAETFGARLVKKLPRAIASCDCMVVTTPGQVSQSQLLRAVKRRNRPLILVDLARRDFDPDKLITSGIRYRGLGRGL